jgi:cytochrome c oxidase cbb3-type subunit 3
MHVRDGLIAATALGLTVALTVRVTAQAPQTPPPPPPPVQGHGGPPPPGQQTQPPPQPQPQPSPERERDARFPAHQRPPVDPAVVERGRGLYAGTCAPCHGVDARGGQLGGPNLLRSQLVLNDQNGELILPVVKNGRPGTTMLPLPMSEPDVKAVASFLHSLQAEGTMQGGPPPGPPVVLNILVGSATAGTALFAEKCSKCHSPTGDLQGIATRIPDAKALQNTWVSGGRALGRGTGRTRGSAESTTTATITLASGEQFEGGLVRVDDFLITIAQDGGTPRTFRRKGDDPKVEIRDPLEGHRQLLAELTNSNMHDLTAYLATLK